jgi:hypothetical protein
MANFSASWINQFVGTPPRKGRTDQNHGRIRLFESLYQAPASGTTPAIADRIIWGQLPLGAVLLGHLGRVDFNAGTASCTINLGDNVTAAKHLAATVISATGSAVPSAASFSATGVGDVLINTFQITNVRAIGAYTVGDLLTGTGIPSASSVSIVDIPGRTITFTNLAGTPASATNAGVSITATGHSYRVSDNSANEGNGYVSTLDDATLVSVVAGAQIANNQMIRLLMPYVMD